MNLRCIYCQTPFTLGRAEMLTAIIHMTDKNMNHYDAHCPRCRRANSISRQRMELFYPNWQDAAKQQAAAPVPPPLPVATTTPSTPLKTEPFPKVVKPVPGKKPVAKKTTAAKKATAKPSVKAKKPAAAKSKTAAKKAPGKKAPVKGRKK